MFKNIFFLLIIVLLISPKAFGKKVEIISKVNNKIIREYATNYWDETHTFHSR